MHMLISAITLGPSVIQVDCHIISTLCYAPDSATNKWRTATNTHKMAFEWQFAVYIFRINGFGELDTARSNRRLDWIFGMMRGTVLLELIHPQRLSENLDFCFCCCFAIIDQLFQLTETNESFPHDAISSSHKLQQQNIQVDRDVQMFCKHADMRLKFGFYFFSYVRSKSSLDTNRR